MGFPNIVADSGFSVEGCVYELPQDHLSLLDTCVGFPEVIKPFFQCCVIHSTTICVLVTPLPDRFLGASPWQVNSSSVRQSKILKEHIRGEWVKGGLQR